MKLLISLTLLLSLLTGCPYYGPDAAQQGTAPTPDGVVTPTPEATPEPTPTPEATPTPIPTPTPDPYDYTAPVPAREGVADDWFADAVFIGDSRTDGLRLYGGIKGVDVLCYKGLTVFEVMEDKPVIRLDGENMGVLQALGKKQYAKVYLSLGLNELGYRNDQSFADTYAAMVDQVKQLQPDADIYLQSLIPLNTQKLRENDKPAYLNNEQVAVYNAIIEKVAAEKQVYYLNVKEVVVDEAGELPYDASNDGIHFLRDGYAVWYEYLKTHTVE